MATSLPASPDASPLPLLGSRGLFVTGTGTGVGKSVVAASVIATAAASGLRVAAFKPAVSGLDERDPDWPPDHELLAFATGWQSPEQITPYSFGPAVSPHLAAELSGQRIDRTTLAAAFSQAAAGADAIICEGVGGLLVPLSVSPRLSVLDLIIAYGLPALVVGHPGLGTISDVCLTIDRLRAESVAVAGVVLTPWPSAPGPIHESNLRSIEALTDVAVATLPMTSLGSLANHGAALPIENWLQVHGEASG